MFLEFLKTPNQVSFEKIGIHYQNKSRDFCVRQEGNKSWKVDIFDFILAETTLIYMEKFESRQKALESAFKELSYLKTKNEDLSITSNDIEICRRYYISCNKSYTLPFAISGNSNMWILDSGYLSIGKQAELGELFRKYGYINKETKVISQKKFKTRNDIIIMLLTILDKELINLYDQKIYCEYKSAKKNMKDVSEDAWWCHFVRDDIDLTSIF